jgi:hypothetical protein
MRMCAEPPPYTSPAEEEHFDKIAPPHASLEASLWKKGSRHFAIS